ncbi:MAG: hypothetical protein NNA18_07885 [Nitrospira sp.]|nr:hypothetical protein [Nitrospira sp.]
MSLSTTIKSGSHTEPHAALIQYLLARLDHVHVQLDELQQDQPADRHHVLALSMKTYIAEIGACAVKGNLPDVKELCDRTLLLAEKVQPYTTERRADDYVALCRSLGQIRQLLVRSIHVTTDRVPSSSREREGCMTIAVGDLLAALHRLRESRTGSGQSSGHLLQTMIDEVEKLRKTRVERCGTTFLNELLDECLKRTIDFAMLVQAQVPLVIETLELLAKEKGEGHKELGDRLQGEVERTARLVSVAKQASAPQVACLEGVLGFLTMVIQQRVVIAALRYETVASRMRAYLSSISRWIEEEIAAYSVICDLVKSERRKKETTYPAWVLSPHTHVLSEMSGS